MGLPEFSRRWEFGQQLIRANGVTYNVYGDPQAARGRGRWTWCRWPSTGTSGRRSSAPSSSAPRCSTPSSPISTARTACVRDGHVPPELVFDNPGFLRACHGIAPTSGVYLHNYAVDIARAPNGTWWVISDRTQAPSGAGYALENRLVSARTLPAHARPVPRAAAHRLLRGDDQGAARPWRPTGPANPRVVVLSAGPNSETYFEHSFFARQWDFPLVGGADLTVRDSRVYLKTLAGLNPVDVILRRLDDDFCDPLELRGDSLLGVPGLVQAARAGTVFIANCLGSGLVETPALMAFLPGLCRHVLGEELRMPSVATWWCGQDEPRRRRARASRDAW